MNANNASTRTPECIQVGHFDFDVGNVKALLKLNVENESMKRDRGEWEGL